ncbi:MAG: hypothetical protein Q4C95_10450 [Planctomycetia bacterium]|nr:hypothetical protein [Planctomycetia bacterium]
MKYFSIALLLIVSFVVIGCSKGPKKPKELPKLYPLTITLTQEGVPCAEAHINLEPVEKKESFKWSLGGLTDANGVLKIMTNGNWDGCPEGEYIVRVSKEVILERAEAQEGAGEGMPTKIIRTIPKKYGSKSTSDLKITVKAGQNDEKLDIGPAIEENVPVAG